MNSKLVLDIGVKIIFELSKWLNWENGIAKQFWNNLDASYAIMTLHITALGEHYKLITYTNLKKSKHNLPKVRLLTLALYNLCNTLSAKVYCDGKELSVERLAHDGQKKGNKRFDTYF